MFAPQYLWQNNLVGVLHRFHWFALGNVILITTAATHPSCCSSTHHLNSPKRERTLTLLSWHTMNTVSKAWGRVTSYILFKMTGVCTKYWLQIIFPFHTLGFILLRHLLSAPWRIIFQVFDALGAAACVFLMQYLLSTPSWVGYLLTTLGSNLVLCLIYPEEEAVEGAGGGWGECGLMRRWIRDSRYLGVARVSFNSCICRKLTSVQLKV